MPTQRAALFAVYQGTIAQLLARATLYNVLRCRIKALSHHIAAAAAAAVTTTVAAAGDSSISRVHGLLRHTTLVAFLVRIN